MMRSFISVNRLPISDVHMDPVTIQCVVFCGLYIVHLGLGYI